MNLKITTPLAVLADEDDVIALRAEDASGGFGILPGHTDFLTSLAISVVSWRRHNGAVRYAAVRGGILSVTGGQDIGIATREAVLGEDPLRLEQDILASFHTAEEAARIEHVEQARLQLSAIRQIMRHLRPGGTARGLP